MLCTYFDWVQVLNQEESIAVSYNFVDYHSIDDHIEYRHAEARHFTSRAVSTNDKQDVNVMFLFRKTLAFLVSNRSPRHTTQAAAALDEPDEMWQHFFERQIPKDLTIEEMFEPARDRVSLYPDKRWKCNVSRAILEHQWDGKIPEQHIVKRHRGVSNQPSRNWENDVMWRD